MNKGAKLQRADGRRFGTKNQTRKAKQRQEPTEETVHCEDIDVKSSDTSDSDYVPEEDLLVPGQHRKSLGRLKELVGDNEGEVDDDFEDIEGFTDGNNTLYIRKTYFLYLKQSIRLMAMHGCKGRLNVVEHEKHMKGFDGCI